MTTNDRHTLPHVENIHHSAHLSSGNHKCYFVKKAIFCLQARMLSVRMLLWRTFILQQLLIRPQKLRTM